MVESGRGWPVADGKTRPLSLDSSPALLRMASAAVLKTLTPLWSHLVYSSHQTNTRLQTPLSRVEPL